MSDRNPEITGLRLGKFLGSEVECIEWESDKNSIGNTTEALSELADTLGKRLQDKELLQSKRLIWDSLDDVGMSETDSVYMDEGGIELTVFVDTDGDRYVVRLSFGYSFQGVYAYF